MSKNKLQTPNLQFDIIGIPNDVMPPSQHARRRRQKAAQSLSFTTSDCQPGQQEIFKPLNQPSGFAGSGSLHLPEAESKCESVQSNQKSCKRLPVNAALLVTLITTAVTMVVRVYYVIGEDSMWILHPDEIYQSLEVAHADVYGYGFLEYEFLPPSKGSNTSLQEQLHQELGMYAMRSPVYPQFYVLVSMVAKMLGISVAPFMVWRLAHVLVSSLLPLAVYHFTSSLFRSRDIGVIAAVLVASDVNLSVLGTHTLVHSLLAPILFMSLTGIWKLFGPHFGLNETINMETCQCDKSFSLDIKGSRVEDQLNMSVTKSKTEPRAVMPGFSYHVSGSRVGCKNNQKTYEDNSVKKSDLDVRNQTPAHLARHEECELEVISSVHLLHRSEPEEQTCAQAIRADSSTSDFESWRKISLPFKFLLSLFSSVQFDILLSKGHFSFLGPKPSNGHRVCGAGLNKHLSKYCDHAAIKVLSNLETCGPGNNAKQGLYATCRRKSGWKDGHKSLVEKDSCACNIAKYTEMCHEQRSKRDSSRAGLEAIKQFLCGFSVALSCYVRPDTIVFLLAVPCAEIFLLALSSLYSFTRYTLQLVGFHLCPTTWQGNCTLPVKGRTSASTGLTSGLFRQVVKEWWDNVLTTAAIKGKKLQALCSFYCVAGMTAGIALGILEDFRFYGFGILSPINWYRFNFDSLKVAQMFGNDTSIFYADKLFNGNLGLVLMTVVNLVGFVLLFAVDESRLYKRVRSQSSPMRTMAFLADGTQAAGPSSLGPRVLRLAVTCAGLLTCYSLQPHKELRFLHHLLVLYLILTAALLWVLAQRLSQFVSACGRQILTGAFLAAFLALSWCRVVFPGNGSFLSEWAFESNSGGSQDVMKCVRYIAAQSDVRGVFYDVSGHSVGGYALLHHDVPIITLTQSYYLEYDLTSRTPSGSRRSIASSIRPSNLFLQSNLPYLYRHLVKRKEYNYLVLRSQARFAPVGYLQVFRTKTFKVLQRTATEVEEEQLRQHFSRPALGPDQCWMLEREAKRLFAFGLQDLASNRYHDFVIVTNATSKKLNTKAA